jgi:Domain of unknown function (DUF4190)
MESAILEEDHAAAQGAGAREGTGDATASTSSAPLCVAAMVVGIVAVVVPFAELLLSIPAVVLAIAALRRVRKQPDIRGSRGMAVAGLVLGLISLAMCVPSVIILVQII